MNKVSKKSEKSGFSKGLVHVFVKKSCFLPFLPRQKRSFFNIPDWKEYVLDKMNKVSKISKESKFFKAVSPWLFFKKVKLFTNGAVWENHGRKDSFRIFQIQRNTS